MSPGEHSRRWPTWQGRTRRRRWVRKPPFERSSATSPCSQSWERYYFLLPEPTGPASGVFGVCCGNLDLLCSLWLFVASSTCPEHHVHVVVVQFIPVLCLGSCLYPVPSAATLYLTCASSKMKLHVGTMISTEKACGDNKSCDWSAWIACFDSGRDCWERRQHETWQRPLLALSWMVYNWTSYLE